MDPWAHWLGSPGSKSVFGMRVRIQEQGNWPKFTSSLSKRLLLRYRQRYVLWHITYIKYIFHLKSSWRQNMNRIRILMYSLWLGSLDSDPHWNQCGSTTQIKFIIYLPWVLCLSVCDSVCVCVCVTIAELTAILLVLIIKLTKQARWMDWRWRYYRWGDRKGTDRRRRVWRDFSLFKPNLRNM